MKIVKIIKESAHMRTCDHIAGDSIEISLSVWHYKAKSLIIFNKNDDLFIN